jgi:hypothetical protein
MTQILRTDAVAPRERIAYWTDAICDVYVQLDCDSPAASDFSGSIERDMLASMEVSVVESQAQHVRRTPRQIAKACEDYFLVSIQDQGQGVVRQDGRTALLQPGDFALYDSTRPYELLFDGDFRQFVLMVPGQWLRTHLRNAERLTATAVCGSQGAGHLLLQMVGSVRREIGLLPPACAPCNRRWPAARPRRCAARAAGRKRARAPGAGRLPPRADQGVRARSLVRSRAQHRWHRRRPAPLARSLAPPLPERADAAGPLHLGAAPGRLPSRPRRPAARPAQRQRHRLRVGLQRRGALQPRLPRALRAGPAGMEGGGRISRARGTALARGAGPSAGKASQPTAIGSRTGRRPQRSPPAGGAMNSAGLAQQQPIFVPGQLVALLL